MNGSDGHDAATTDTGMAADADPDVGGEFAGGGSDYPLSSPHLAAVADGASAANTAELVVPDGADLPKRLSSVLVAVGGGPHSGATVDVGRALADADDAWLELFHVSTPAAEGAEDSPTGDSEAVGERLLDAAQARLDGFDQADRWLVTGETPADAIVEQSAYYDAVVVGAATTGTVGRFVFGSTTDTVLAEANVPVVVVEADGDASLLDD